jgi:hypothetical protein
MKLSLVAVLSLLFCYGCQSQGPQTYLRISELQNQVSMLKAQNAELTKQKDSCTAKFDRATILYDVGLFNTESRSWMIPADVEPVLAPNKNGSYSHYDPKTQTETVHFQGKASAK